MDDTEIQKLARILLKTGLASSEVDAIEHAKATLKAQELVKLSQQHDPSFPEKSTLGELTHHESEQPTIEQAAEEQTDAEEDEEEPEKDEEE